LNHEDRQQEKTADNALPVRVDGDESLTVLEVENLKDGSQEEYADQGAGQ
jgi:hypothetical protein